LDVKGDQEESRGARPIRGARNPIYFRAKRSRLEIVPLVVPVELRLREEIRKRLSQINLYFRFTPLIIGDIQFVNGSKRQVVFWPKEQKAHVIPAEAKELLTQPLEKGIVYFY
jgi:hypothetical protein